MSTRIEPAEELSFGQTLAGLARHYLGGRRALVFGGLSVVAVGLALSWNWVVAIGLAPILLALAPCAVMCVVGVCMHKAHGQAGSVNSQMKDGSET